MHIAVFVKQVPDTSEIQIDRTTNRLIRDGVPSILNPFDCFAVETALRLKKSTAARSLSSQWDRSRLFPF